jgi:peptide/nickel transport system substrate-binding protein
MEQHRISRRGLIARMGGGVALAGLAAACAPLRPKAPDTTPVSGTGQATPAQPRAGGTLILGTTAPIITGHPYPLTSASAPFWWGVFDTLIRLDDRRQPIPHLAESWAASDDHLNYTFKLRQNTKFHSGRAFTAEEAKWSFDYAVDPKTAVTAAGGLKGVKATAIDSTTLKLSFPEPIPELFGLLMYIFMIDPQSDVARLPGGTGPFRFDALEPGNELRLSKSPVYWQSGKPFLDAIAIRTFPDAVALVVHLESSAISAAYCPANDAERLKSSGEFTIVSVPADGNYCYLMNCADPPFNEKRVRQAVNLAIDRRRLTSTLLYGLSTPTYIMWPRNSPAWDASLDVGEFNLGRARQLLADAGYGGGFETTIQATSSQLPEFFLFNQVLQADLAAVGIRARIEEMELQQYTLSRNQAKFPGLLQHQYAYADSDPAMAFTALPLRPEGNVTRFKSDEYTRLIAAARVETDRNKRLELYRDIAMLVKDEAFLVPVTNPVVAYAMRNNVHGFRHLPGGPAYSPVYEEISLT